ncbi:hypothetical protein O0L34_g2898 [Tuta absoluta]|nr:hypothetical protein O0L34_g2898 [Tuta absoluta]
MELHWIAAALLFIAGANASPRQERIVGGVSTDIENLPFIVQVESTLVGLSWSHHCAANIVNNRFVISAASCFDGLLTSTSRRRLRAGSARRGRGGVVVGVARIFNHPSYSSSDGNIQGDIAVVEQSAAWVWSPRIRNVQIPPQDFALPDDLSVALAGWGATKEGGLLGQSSSKLLEVGVQTVNREWCAEQYLNQTARVVDDTMLCTGVQDEGMDSCSGDEGGPVYFRDANGTVSLVGIISWRENCGNPSLPSVNTRVSAYSKWIVINAL